MSRARSVNEKFLNAAETLSDMRTERLRKETPGMGLLLFMTAFAGTIWIWANLGWGWGVLAGIASPFLVGALRAKASKKNLEFHEAWDSLLGPPMDPDAFSAKRLHRSLWKKANRETGVSPRQYLMSHNRIPSDPGSPS